MRGRKRAEKKTGTNFYISDLDLQSTRFMDERSTSNVHRLVHSSISFFEKFSDSLKLGFYIRNTILVIRNFFCNIVIIIQTFRTELKS